MKIKEALEDGTLSLEDDIDYADMTEEEYKQEIERLHSIIKEVNELIEEYRYTNVEDYGKIIEFFKKLKTILDKENK